MALTPLLPIATSVIGPLVANTVDRLTSGLSFLEVLHGDSVDARPTKADSTAMEPQTQPPDLDEFIAALREQFAALGVDLAVPVRLKSDGRDGVIVDGPHPQRVLIESVFNSVPELARQFHAAARGATRQPAADGRSVEDVRLVLDRHRFTLTSD